MDAAPPHLLALDDALLFVVFLLAGWTSRARTVCTRVLRIMDENLTFILWVRSECVLGAAGPFVEFCPPLAKVKELRKRVRNFVLQICVGNSCSQEVSDFRLAELCEICQPSSLQCRTFP
mmetsp:Transcript_21816/g.59765  ORF Transcript_21816/g.59765 Transcript_21816/m.59765 type:complete len:120 (-) Transcript_21816:228-587(-)